MNPAAVKYEISFQVLMDPLSTMKRTESLIVRAVRTKERPELDL